MGLFVLMGFTQQQECRCGLPGTPHPHPAGPQETLLPVTKESQVAPMKGVCLTPYCVSSGRNQSFNCQLGRLVSVFSSSLLSILFSLPSSFQLSIVGIEPKASSVLGKCSAPELHPHPSFKNTEKNSILLCSLIDLEPPVRPMLAWNL